MTAVTANQSEPGVTTNVREATAEDNRGLLALAASCSMRGDMTLRIQREPDFFALNRLEGSDWHVGVIDADYRVAGCIATSLRDVYLNGIEALIGYVGDLKVHPIYRNAKVADALSNYAGARMDALPDGTPTLITVLAGNKAMERRLSGPRGVPDFEWLATIRSHSIPVLWKRRMRVASTVTVERAKWSDLNQMVGLWNQVARARQFAPVLDAHSLAQWIRQAPGLDISSYLLARSREGELLGFLALWDQSSFKQMYVERYSRRMSVVAALANAITPRFGGARLARPGEQMCFQTALHVCVPGESPETLKSLLVAGHNGLRNTSCAFFNIGIDIADPLSSAADGLLAQPTDINAYVGTRGTPLDLESLKRRPLHYEIGLV